MDLDDRVDEHEGCEESGVHVGDVGEVVAAHGVADADYGSGHEVAFRVDQVEEVAGVVVPIRIVAEVVLIQDTAGALVRDVCDPYAAYTKIVGF